MTSPPERNCREKDELGEAQTPLKAETDKLEFVSVVREDRKVSFFFLGSWRSRMA
jgi:hypothetical protein